MTKRISNVTRKNINKTLFLRLWCSSHITVAYCTGACCVQPYVVLFCQTPWKLNCSVSQQTEEWRYIYSTRPATNLHHSTLCRPGFGVLRLGAHQESILLEANVLSTFVWIILRTCSFGVWYYTFCVKQLRARAHSCLTSKHVWQRNIRGFFVTNLEICKC